MPGAASCVPSPGAHVSCDILAEAIRTYLSADPLHSLLRSGDSNEEQKKDERVTSLHSPQPPHPPLGSSWTLQPLPALPITSHRAPQHPSGTHCLQESPGLSSPCSSLFEAAWPALLISHLFLQPYPSLLGAHWPCQDLHGNLTQSLKPPGLWHPDPYVQRDCGCASHGDVHLHTGTAWLDMR